MIPETPTLQRKVSSGEERYTNLIKNEFVKHAKEINKLGKLLEGLDRGSFQEYCTKEEVEDLIERELENYNPILQNPVKTSELINDSGFISEVYWGDILNRPNKFTPSSHTHTWEEIVNKPSFSRVATSGNYSDLIGTPIKLSEFVNDSGFISNVRWGEIINKPTTFPPSTHTHQEYLPLTGGTLTGDLYMQNPINKSVGFMLTNTDPDNTNYRKNLDIGWNYENRDGAGFYLRSVDWSGSESGAFGAYARNATDSCDLRGYPDGRLTWGGTAISLNGHTHSEYLPLSGGTISGTITVNSTTVPLNRSANNSYLQINGGKNTAEGASLILFGKDESRAGEFWLTAHNGTTSKQLKGNPDGTLTWGGTAISLNGHTHSYLPLSGGTLTSGGYIHKKSSQTKGTNPSGTVWILSNIVYDSAGTATANRLSEYRSFVDNNGKVGTEMLAYDFASGATSNTYLGVYKDLNGATHVDTNGQLVINRNNGSAGGGIKLTGAGQNYAMSALNTNVTKGTAPSSTQYWGIDFYGKDNTSYNQRIGMLETTVNTNNVATTSIRAYNCTTNTNTNNCAISVNVDGSGNAYTSAPTPATSDNSTKIATTAYVKSNLGSYLPLSGGTMTGTIKRNGDTIVGTADTAYTRFCGGSGDNKGAGLTLGGSTHSWAGKFQLKAHNGTNSAVLEGTATGGLTWAGLDIAPQKWATATFADKSIPNGTVTNVGSFTLTKGTWLVVITADFASNATGYRQVQIATSTTGGAVDRYKWIRHQAANGASTHVVLTTLDSVSANTTRYVNVNQNSGSALNFTAGGYIAFRLSNANS